MQQTARESRQQTQISKVVNQFVQARTELRLGVSLEFLILIRAYSRKFSGN